MAGANGDSPIYSLSTSGNHSVNFKTHYAVKTSFTRSHLMVGSDWYGAGTKESVIEGSCRTELPSSRRICSWFLFRRCPEHHCDLVLSATIRFCLNVAPPRNHGWGCGSAMAHRGVFSIYQDQLGGRLRSALMDGLASPHHF